MIILDTSGVLSAIDGGQRHHEAAAAVLRAEDEPAILSPFVLAEIDYLLATRVGVDAERAFLAEVAGGAYRLAPFDASDVEAAAAVVDRYRDQNIGLTDASLVILALRHRTNRLLTLDERHFRVVRPLQRFRSFRLLPLDA
ncbi:MAG: PIN domain-containing protein [Actinomycetota bacterium]